MYIEVSVALLSVVFALSYVYVKYKFCYWKRRNVPYLEPNFPFGNFKEMFFFRTSMAQQVTNIYSRFNTPFVGIYISLRSALVLRDPDLVRRVMIIDFQHFTDRGVYVDEVKDPLTGQVFSLTGAKWKYVRGKLTPAFTSGKLKLMFQTLVDTGLVLQKFLEKPAEQQDTIEVRDIVARYTTDVIASNSFGIDNDSINDNENLFRKMGKRFFEPTTKNGIRAILFFFLPSLVKFLTLRKVDDDVEEFIFNVVEQTMDHREQNNIVRKDFMQLLLQLKNTGTVQIDGDWEIKNGSESKQKKLSANEVTAQALIFFLAGFETTSSTITNCVYELAKHPKLMKRVQSEIDEVMEANDNKLTYDSINAMKYLNSCIDETLRKYPPIPLVTRECVKSYKVPESDLIIEKGTLIILPLIALHRDPRYYPDPMKFNPDRFFLPKEKTNDKHIPYAPFGEGPRTCIGLRLGKMQSKVGLVMMLSKFKYELGNDMPDELVMSPETFLLSPIGGINLKISYR